jgi:hypothetical protein
MGQRFSELFTTPKIFLPWFSDEAGCYYFGPISKRVFFLKKFWHKF